MQVLGVNAKGGFQGFEVLVVLSQRVLEFERALVELLRPLRLLLAAENPAAHVLRFQHEDAVGERNTWSICVVPSGVFRVTLCRRR